VKIQVIKFNLENHLQHICGWYQPHWLKLVQQPPM